MKATFEIDAVQGHSGRGKNRRSVWIEHDGKAWVVTYMRYDKLDTTHRTLREAKAAARAWLEEER